jgi:hypothetical protein
VYHHGRDLHSEENADEVKSLNVIGEGDLSKEHPKRFPKKSIVE